MDTTLPLLFDRAQISRWFDQKTVVKALSYVDSVSALEWGDGALSGLVQGTAREPYEVDVHFYREAHRLEVEGECSCPVGLDCKHVVALLLASLENRSPPSSELRPELVAWLDGFKERAGVEGADPKIAKPIQKLAYALTRSPREKLYRVEFFKASIGKDGGIRSIGQPWNNVENALTKPPQFIGDEDLGILRLLWVSRSRDYYGGYVLQGQNGSAALERMLATERLFMTNDYHEVTGSALRLGQPREGQVQWQPCTGDRMRPVLHIDPVAIGLVATDPVWYLDPSCGEAGFVALPSGSKRITEFLSMPPVSPAEASLVAAVLQDIAPDLPPPPGQEVGVMRNIDTEPVPVLCLDTLPVYSGSFGGFGFGGQTFDHATVRFDYDGFQFKSGTTSTLVKAQNGEMVQVKRRLEIEKKRLGELRKAGLESIPSGRVYGPRAFPADMLGMSERDGWPNFMSETLPALRNAGWRVEMAGGFSFNVIDIDDIDGELRQAADGWFDVEMGIVVGDRTVRLEPLLAELFQRDRRWLTGGIDKIINDEPIELKTDRGERLRFRAERLKPVVRVLIDLFDSLGDGPMRVSRFDAGRFEALNDTGRWQFHGDESVRHLAQRLKSGEGVREVAIPKGLCAELRTYQRQGLNWMQFLREHDLSGVLADDMGLGKTVQTLAHLMAEKEAGRLSNPALIVVPTSLVHNWQDEAQRFAPSLRVLRLHGSQRKVQFDQILEHDLVLTTYPLLWRDHDVLSKHHYHLLILDEAQLVKNSLSKAAVAIRDLKAKHRLCLTGTPLENHLGELWSLFDFLLPGFLGSHKDFSKYWRGPIEKGGDMVRRDLLARRIRPFMLRRRKDDVARELPPKTVIVRSVDLDGGQRDLYEIVRAAMQEKVRDAIAAQGMNRSHIVVLDALLKLRQVCCDPRLVKLPKAATVKESAKLDLLLSMVPELIEEGRRILLFSQFTGMLALIAAALDKAGIAYVTLTGDTTDRATPVRRFQEGAVPLFLISLKAGGVGLNLTAADTVIHYDPWWNPAAENQATDRAHRLGQDKPVFVYKLIAAGSIEEKIVALQEKKAALAAGILSDDGAAAVKFSNDDLEALFAPIAVMK